MRSASNYHPEWGYLSPSTNLIRTARIALIAVVIGGMAGASAVLSLVGRSASETSVADRTLQRPGKAASVPVGTPQAAQVKTQAAIQDQPTKPALADESRTANESSARSSAQPATSGAAATEVAATSTVSPENAGSYQARAADKAAVQKKATRKWHPISRYASRGEHVYRDRGPRRPLDDQSLFGSNVPAEYYPRRGYGGYYREQSWGNYYPDYR